MNDFILGVKPLAGTNIDEAAKDAVRLAKQLHVGITFKFNGVQLTAFGHSNPSDIAKEYDDALKTKG